jgi:hypothetical protein
MDASLVLAVDGLRSLAQTSSELITANSLDGGDRTAFALGSDTELACLTVLGAPKQQVREASAIAKKTSFLFPGFLGGNRNEENNNTASTNGEENVNNNSGSSEIMRPELKAMTPVWFEAQRQAQLCPITDIVLVFGEESLPRGFVKVTHSVTGAYPADLNSSSGPRQAWLAVARSSTAPPITALSVVVLELGEFVPPGFQAVRHPLSGKPANFRIGSNPPSETYLCFSRAPGAPIIDIGIAFPYGASRQPALRNLLPLSSTDNGTNFYKFFVQVDF